MKKELITLFGRESIKLQLSHVECSDAIFEKGKYRMPAENVFRNNKGAPSA